MHALHAETPAPRSIRAVDLPSVGELEPPDATLLAVAGLDECERRALIQKLSRMLHEPAIPADARSAGLTLIGWLARRMPGEAADTCGLPCAEPELEHAPRSMRRTKTRG